MNSEESRTDKVIQKAENIADVLLRHLQEEGGCNHNVNGIVEEAFGPTLESKSQYPNCSIPSMKERVTT
jgi:hypothetical protein